MYRSCFVCSISLATIACGSPNGGDGSNPTRQETPAFSLDEGTMTLNPGQEGLFCRQMPVPSEQLDSFITGLDADVSLGTHHMIVTFSDGDMQSEPPLCKDTGSGQVTSGNASFQDFASDPNPLSVIETVKRIAFGGGGGNARVRFPASYGKPMPRGFFESSHHLLNAGTEPIQVHGRFDVYTAEADEIAFPLGVLFANQFTIAVAPQSDGFVEGTLTTAAPIDVVAFMSHAHNYLRRFEMFIYRNGAPEAEPVYVSEDWETPRVQVEDPPLHLEAGEGITFRCTYHNDMTTELGWGVTDGEMCMPLAMYAYPPGAPRAIPPTMSVALYDATPAALREGTSGFFGQ